MSIRFADPEVQELDTRSFGGGWPLALSGNGGGCPDFAPTICTGISTTNPQCCPSGQTCSGDSITSYCCPSTGDCRTYAETFPACANTTWNMFIGENSNYFCCEQGQIGVLPTDGWDGICEPASQVVPASLSATVATQIGVATGGSSAGSVPSIIESSAASTTSISSAAASSTSTPQTTLTSTTLGQTLTSTSRGNSPTTSGSTTSPTGGSSSGSQSGSAPNSSSTITSATKAAGLGIGPIIGIVIGGLAIILLAGIFWALLRRRRPAPQPAYQPAPVAESPLPPSVRKPVAQVTDRQVFAGGNGYGPPQATPPRYSNATEQYVPPPPSDYGPPRTSTYSPPQSGFASPYSELDDSNHPRVAELRGTRTGD